MDHRLPQTTLGASLLQARLPSVRVTAPGEAELLAYLQDKLRESGPDARPDVIAGLFFALKLRAPLVCMAEDGPPPIVFALAMTIAGGSDLMKVRTSPGAGAVPQRFDALRITDFIAESMEDDVGRSGGARDPRVLVVEVRDAVGATVTFIDRQIRETVVAAKRRLPLNVFVIVTAPVVEAQFPRPWVALRVPLTTQGERQPVTLPTLGYGRRLVSARLGFAAYRRTLRRFGSRTGLASKLLKKWLVASFDDAGRGLLVPRDAGHNLRAAEALYRDMRLWEPSP
jgi:hypothetical protein